MRSTLGDRARIREAELRFAYAQLRKEARGSINEEQVFSMHERQTALVVTATKATKAARRRKEPQPARAAPLEPAVDSIDYNKEVIPLESELWESRR